MSRVYLCQGNYARTPYVLERGRLRIYSVEELCYYLKENAWLLDENVISLELADWLEKECGFVQLAQRIRLLVRGQEKTEVIAGEILGHTGYYSRREVQEIQKRMMEGADVAPAEKKKRRADELLESRHYAAAVHEYRGILNGSDPMSASLRGRIYHNMGVAQASLFLFEKAAEAFEQAWSLSGEKESLCSLLAAKRMALSEGEYLGFITGHPEYHEASLELESSMEERSRSWTESRNDSVVSSIKSAFFAGDMEECDRLMEEEEEKLKEAYREYVMQ